MLFLSFFVIATLTFGFRFGKYHIYTKKRVNYVYQIENFESKNQNLVEVVGNTSHIPLNHPVIDIVLNRFESFIELIKVMTSSVVPPITKNNLVFNYLNFLIDSPPSMSREVPVIQLFSELM
jgi:hypothetical protein